MDDTHRLYVGNIPWSTTDDELRALFAECDGVTRVEIPTGRQGRSRGYGLVEFASEREARDAVSAVDGVPMGDRTITVREDKAPTKSAGGSKKMSASTLGDAPAGGDGCRCYFGNLAWETSEETLTGHAATFGVNVVQCEVARQSGGRSKGWALVDFATPEEAQNAIEQMHNSEIQGRSVIVRVERPGAGQKSARVETRPENSSGLQIVVRNLPWTTTSEDLRQVFQQVGNVVNAVSVCHTDTGRSKGWGTVLFETREQAQAAIQGFNGVELEHRPMQIKLDRYD